MKDLIILGVGEHAMEMAEIVERVNALRPTWRMLGYIASQRQSGLVNSRLNEYQVLGTPDIISSFPEAHFVPSVVFHDVLNLPPGRMVSLIDPTAYVPRTSHIGPGSVIYPHCFVGGHTSTGERLFMLSGGVLNHDNVIGNNVCVCAHATTAGYVSVEDGCYLGQACAIRQHLRIGRDSLIGMGAVVIRDVPPNSVMVGNPAHKLRDRSSIS
jgi:sugar O-acyltransferase (sialic acid O-acetyltransferase NeuD family)